MLHSCQEEGHCCHGKDWNDAYLCPLFPLNKSQGFISFEEIVEPHCLKGRTAMEKKYERFDAPKLFLFKLGGGVGGTGGYFMENS